MRTPLLKIKNISIVMVIFFSNVANGQIIDSLKIIPSNPTAINTVKVICYQFKPTGGCSIAFGPNESIISDTFINIATYLQLDSFATACNFVDTFSLGIFTPDNYQVDYNLTDGWGNFYFRSITFTVTPSTSIINSFEFEENKIRIFPNPFETSALMIIEYGENENYQLFIYDNMGKLVRKIDKIIGRTVQIKRENLKNGIYFYKLFNENQLITKGKMIID